MKPTARLTGALLARKGYATPAETPSHFHFPFAAVPNQVDSDHEEYDLPPEALDVAADEGLGADSAYIPDPLPHPPVEKPHKERIATFGRRKALVAAMPARRVAMTLRLSEERHLRLRVFSAHTKRSSQDILTDALDDYLKRNGNTGDMRCCECLHPGDGKH